LDALVLRRGADPGGDLLALGHVARGENHVRAPLGQDTRRLLSQSARAARDQRHLATQVDAVGHLARGRLGAERRRVTHGDSPLLLGTTSACRTALAVATVRWASRTGGQTQSGRRGTFVSTPIWLAAIPSTTAGRGTQREEGVRA